MTKYLLFVEYLDFIKAFDRLGQRCNDVLKQIGQILDEKIDSRWKDRYIVDRKIEIDEKIDSRLNDNQIEVYIERYINSRQKDRNRDWQIDSQI